MDSSLSTRILCKAGLAICCCIVLFGIAEFYQTRFQLQSELDKTLDATGKRLGNALAMPLWNVDKEALESIVIVEMQIEHIEVVVVRDYLNNGMMVAMGRDSSWRIIEIDQPDSLDPDRLIDFPILLNEERLGTVRVIVTDRFFETELIKSIGWLILRLFILLILVLALLTFFVHRIIARPLRVLCLDCKKVSWGEYDTILDTERKDEIGNLARIFVHMRDDIQGKTTAFSREIHERKKSEEELRSLRAYLSDMVESMPSILVSVDRDFRIKQWNSEAERVTGLKRSEVCERMLTEVLPSLMEMEVQLQDALVSGKEGSEPRCSLVIGGVRRLMDMTVYPLRLKGSEGAVIRLDDITEKVRLEEIMLQTEKMMSVGGLAAGMAHEINNPLAGIMQSAQVMQTRFLPDLEKNRQAAQECEISMEALNCYLEKRDIPKMVESILQSGSRAARIITNMLSFSRKGSSEHLPCDLSKLLEKTIELAANDYDLRKKFDFRRIKIIREYDEDVGLINCDGSAIQQVFFNMLKNGAQAMISDVNQEMTEADFEPTLNLRIYQQSHSVCIEFEDNGPGMEEETLKQVFEPFFSTKAVGVGTGLGLSVSYFIIKENHRGTIDVASQPGKGTTFTISLPRLGNEP